jgi:hypothetical protein
VGCWLGYDVRRCGEESTQEVYVFLCDEGGGWGRVCWLGLVVGGGLVLWCAGCLAVWAWASHLEVWVVSIGWGNVVHAALSPFWHLASHW